MTVPSDDFAALTEQALAQGATGLGANDLSDDEYLREHPALGLDYERSVLPPEMTGSDIDRAWAAYTSDLFGSSHPQKAHQKRSEAFKAGYKARAAVERGRADDLRRMAREVVAAWKQRSDRGHTQRAYATVELADAIAALEALAQEQES